MFIVYCRLATARAYIKLLIESDDIALFPEIGVGKNSRFIFEYCAHNGPSLVDSFRLMAKSVQTIEQSLWKRFDCTVNESKIRSVV